MSEELTAQLREDERFAGLSPFELERIVDLVAKLREISLFDSLEDLELACIAQRGREIHRERGDVIIHQGDTDRAFYVILNGQVRVWKRDEAGRTLLLNYHGKGDFFGELIFLGREDRAATVDVVDDTDLVAFDQEGFERIVQHRQISNYLRYWGPERVRRNNAPFKGKQWDEITIVQERKSWLALAQMIAFPILIILLTLAVWGVLSRVAQVPADIMLSIVLAITVGMGLWIAWMWQDWRNDDFIVTSKRVIHIERVLIPPFPTERHEAAIEMVQDITTRSQGLLTYLFNVRTLEIQTSGAGTIRFPHLNNADQIRNEIYRARDLARIRKSSEERTRIRDKLFAELGRPVKTVTPLESGERIEITPQPTGLMTLVDYFVPRTRIVQRDRIIWRKHWLVLATKVGPAIGLFLLALALLVLAFAQPGIVSRLAPMFTILPAGLFVLITFGWYLWRYEEWRKDIYIVTDTRIIDIEGSPFHIRKEKRTEGTFDVIQNIDYDSPNLLYRILRMGDVTIDTAAQQKAFTFDSVPHPEEVQQEIFKRLAAYRERKEREESERRYAEFAKWFETYHRSVVEPRE